MRYWAVASSIVVTSDQYLLVANRRRNGAVDWSPPGGVIDAGEQPLEALHREVLEETGLAVKTWSKAAYEVQVRFIDLKMQLDVVVHQAVEWSGELLVDDPDGIVEQAQWCDAASCRQRLVGAPRWVVEPFLEFLFEEPQLELTRYEVRGERLADAQVRRLEP